MELTEYQRLAWDFATPEARSFDYLLPGLDAEIGELNGKIAKSVRDKWTLERLEVELLPELGDSAWFCAGILSLSGLKFKRVPFVTSRKDAQRKIIRSYAGLVDAGEWQFCEPLLSHCTTYALACLGRENYTRAEFYTFLDRALTHNLAKLTSRRDRGVIGGSGDHR